MMTVRDFQTAKATVIASEAKQSNERQNGSWIASAFAR
jgi:hypothetical protein